MHQYSILMHILGNWLMLLLFFFVLLYANKRVHKYNRNNAKSSPKPT